MEKEEYEKVYRGASPEFREKMPPPEEAFPPSKAETRVRERGEYQEGKEHVEGLAYRQKQQRAREEGVERGAKRGVGLAARIGTGILKGASLVSKLKGIKTEDQIIKNKPLYFLGEGLSPRMQPLPTPYDRNNPMTLYGYGRKKMPEGAQTVLVVMQKGYEVEQLEVMTGLSPSQLMRAIQYLKKEKLWQEEWE